MKINIKPLAVAGTLAVCAAAICGTASAQEVKVGVVAATTGVFAFVGSPLSNGIRMAAEELNAKKYLGATRLNMLYEDNRSDKQEAIGLVNRMATRDNVLMVIGVVSTGEAMAVGPVAADLKIPLFTTAFSPDVLKAGPWIYKSTDTAASFMIPTGKFVAEKLKAKSCFLVFIRDNDGFISTKNAFRDTIKAGGVNVAADESILAADSDFTALATKIASSKADCLFLSMPPEQAANLVLQGRQAGMPATTQIVGNTAMASDRYFKAGGTAVEGTLVPTDFVPEGMNDFSKAFVANYTKRFGTAPDNWAATGYSMMLVSANAIKNAGPNPTRDGVRQAMLKTQDFPVVTGQGKFSIGADRVPVYSIALLKLKGGKWVDSTR